MVMGEYLGKVDSSAEKKLFEEQNFKKKDADAQTITTELSLE